MPQYLVAVHHPENFDPSSVTEQTMGDIGGASESGWRRLQEPRGWRRARQPGASALRMLPSPRPLSRSEEEPVSPVGSRLSLARWVRCAVRQVAIWDLAQLYRRPAGDDSLAGPRQRLVHVSGFHYRKTTNVLLGFQIRAVGDEHFAIGLRPQRLRLAGCAEAASEEPGTSSFQLVVEHVDIVYRRFVHCRWVEVVGVVNRNQIMGLNFLLVQSSGRPV